jgi:hypothetical protein
MRFHVSIYCIYNLAVTNSTYCRIEKVKLERIARSAIVNRSHTHK